MFKPQVRDSASTRLVLAARVLWWLTAWTLVPSAIAAQANLAWDASTSAAVVGYYVYYGSASRNYPFKVDAGNQVTHTVSNLTAGQTYYFAVTAYDAARAESAFSNEASTTIADFRPPKRPSPPRRTPP